MRACIAIMENQAGRALLRVIGLAAPASRARTRRPIRQAPAAVSPGWGVGVLCWVGGSLFVFFFWFFVGFSPRRTVPTTSSACLTDHLTAAMAAFLVRGKPGRPSLAGGLLANSPPDGYTLYIVRPRSGRNTTISTATGLLPGQCCYAPITLLLIGRSCWVTAKLNISSYKDFSRTLTRGQSFNPAALPRHLAALAEALFAAKRLRKRACTLCRGRGSFATGMMQGDSNGPCGWTTRPHLLTRIG